MGKVLESKLKRAASPAAKKSVKRATPKTSAAKKAPAKQTLRQMNAFLSRNHEQVLKKAKGNALRLIGREVL